MTSREQEIFHPEEVDEQIDAYLAASSTDEQPLDPHALTAIQSLQRSLAPGKQEVALQRVWSRFQQARTTLRQRELAQQAVRVQQNRRYHMRHVTSEQAKERRSKLVHHLNLIAAVIFVVLVVGSTALGFKLIGSRPTNRSASPKTTEENMFVQVDTTLYRLDTTTHKPLWHFQPPGGAFIYAGQVVNNIYYLNVSGSGASSTLYALNVTNGKPLWQLNNVINTVGSYVITNDTIYVVVAKNDNLIIEALNSTSGVVQWEHPLGKATVNNAASKARLYTASAQAVYGTLITTTDTQLFALHTGDGHLLWQKDKGNTFNDSFWGLLVDGILVTLHDTNESVLQGYDAANGALLWSKPSGMILPTIAPRVLNDTIYVSGQSSNDRSVVDILAAFSAKDGALIWTYRSTEIGDASVTEKGVYITRSHKMTRDKDDLIALDPKTGMVRWTHQFQNETPRFPPSVQNDRIYLDLPGGVVQIVQAEDGKVLSSFKVNAPLATNTFVLIQVTD